MVLRVLILSLFMLSMSGCSVSDDDEAYCECEEEEEPEFGTLKIANATNTSIQVFVGRRDRGLVAAQSIGFLSLHPGKYTLTFIFHDTGESLLVRATIREDDRKTVTVVREEVPVD